MSAQGQGALSGATSGAAIGTSIMPGWGTAIGAVAGGIIGAFSSDDSDSSDKQLELAQQDLAFRQKLFEYEKALSGPVRAKLRNEYLSGQSLDYAENAAKIKENFQDLDRRDMNLNYGKTAAGQLGSTIQARLMERAKALGEVYAGGLKANRQVGLSLAGMDQTLQAGMNVSRGNERVMDIYGRNSDIENEANKALMQNVGKSAASIAYGLGRYYEKKDGYTPPSTDDNTPQSPTPGWGLPLPPGRDEAGQNYGRQ